MTTGSAICFFLAAMAPAFGQPNPLAGVQNLAGRPLDPFASHAPARVFVFARTDCPLTNRYAPELQRIAAEFSSRGVEFFLVYADPADTPPAIEKHIAEYRFPGVPLRDPQHHLVKRAEVTVSPEAAVFDSSGHLIYSGRIDDRFVDFGKSRPAPRVHDLEAAIAAVLEGRTVSPARTKAIGCYL